ncbi:type IV pilus modification PilV family protein [Bythopirellula polymerisocia]|uniref:Pseudopilin GspJ n=1 Tax=Bythopirellula polymerisocia TaxID=2528003 RepID=A0A5C6D1D1_9BACT|nr:hypothetical protein [Bythopirellula polymerisocia]TWU29467.1 hypothetical protein Pla144_02450 [Bythopirellula polymerisocia]
MTKLRIHRCGTRSHLRHGISLLEVAISSLLVGVTLVASLQTVGAVYRTQRLNASRLTGSSLAMELMTEILAMPYEDPDINSLTLGRESGESAVNRLDFDDVDDYKNLNSLGVKSKDGTAIADLTAWRRQVDVNWFDPLTGLNAILDSKLKKIVVTVTSPVGDVTTLTAYRSKWGMLEQTPVVDTTAVTWIGATLQVGVGNPSTYIGTQITNLASDAP